MRPEPKRGVLEIAPYVPGRATAPGVAKPIKLSANENPFGCSDAARDAYAAAARDIHLYPDANTTRLRDAIAQHYQLAPERLVFGAGTDEVFAMACQAFLNQGDNIVQPQYAFAAWAIAARAVGGEVKSARERDYTVDVDTLLAAVDDRTRLLFVANPANPTGTWIPFREIERLHAELPPRVLLVLDEAYAECAGDAEGYAEGLAWARDKENVLVTRTFSKAYGLASLRVGWGYAPEHVAAAINRIRLPFSVPRAGEAAAVAALADQAFVTRSAAYFAAGRRQLAAFLRTHGLRPLPSAANFVTVSFKGARATADDVLARLTERGILVRGLRNYGMAECLRITIGTHEEMVVIEAALAELLS